MTPESDLTWNGTFDYALNSLALTDNDVNPGVPLDIRELFVQKVSDLANVERRQYHISAEGCSTSVWKGRSPSTTSGSQG